MPDKPLNTSCDPPAIAGGQPQRLPENYLVFGEPVLGPEEINGLVNCLNQRWIGTGPRSHDFESRFAKYKGIQHAVAVNSGTAAMHLALLASGLGPGDEVIAPAMTFVSTVNAIAHTGATPVLADCDLLTMNVTAKSIQKVITDRTRAIMVVHMCGRCCEMQPILKLARKHNLLVIEDCAHAIESTYQGKPAGTMGHVGCFSFYATKNLTTAEGGMLITQDSTLAGQVKTLACHGLSKDAWDRFSDHGYQHYTVERPGLKYNMPDLNAVIGLAQFSKLEKHASQRKLLWQRYMEKLSALPCQLPAESEPGSIHAHHLFTILLQLDQLAVDRDHVLQALHAENIGVGVHYLPVHWHPYYRKLGQMGQLTNADEVGQRTISLPLTAGMSESDVDDVCHALTRILNYYRK